MWIRTEEGNLLNTDHISSIHVNNFKDMISIQTIVGKEYIHIINCKSKEQAKKFMQEVSSRIKAKTNYVDANQIMVDIGE